MKKYLIAFLIYLLAFQSIAFAANFYCDCSVSGGTGGAGSYGDPFESIADIEAYEVATGFADDDDIYFLEGSTCVMTSDLDIKWEGTGSSNYSILGCYDGENDFDCDGTRPKLQKNGGYNAIYFYDDTSYFRIEYLRLENTEESWQDVGMSLIRTDSDGNGGNGDEGYLTITDCEFYHAGHYALALAQVGTNIIITNNECDDQNGNCIYIIDESYNGSSYGYIAGNTCDELIGYNGNDGHCVGLQSTDYYIVENNTSVDAYNTAFILWIHDVWESNYNIFRNNRTDGNRQIGVSIYHGDADPGGHGNLVYGNIIKSCADETSDRPGIWFNNFNDSEGNYAFNNTIYDAGYGGIGIRSTSGGAIDYITYLNNIVVVDGVTADENELVWVEAAGSNGSNFTIDYNLWWTVPNTDPSGYTLWDTPDDDTPMTWANWKSDGWGGNDIVDNPDFVDTTDFELQPDSPCRNAGGWLTHVTSATGSGTTLNVDNTYILHDDMGLVDEDGNAVDGMLISFYDTTNGRQDREITGITYGTSITLNSSANWIYNGSYPDDPNYTTQIALRFYGSAPDIGAVEYGEEAEPGTGKINISTSGTGKMNISTSGTGKMNR